MHGGKVFLKKKKIQIQSKSHRIYAKVYFAFSIPIVTMRIGSSNHIFYINLLKVFYFFDIIYLKC